MISSLMMNSIAPAAKPSVHRSGTEQSADGFGQAAYRADQKGAAATVADCQQGNRDGEPFRDVLQADAGGQGDAVVDVAAGEAYPHGHAFGKVVQGNGNDEKPDPAQSFGVGPFAPDDEVFVRRVAMNQLQGDGAGQQTEDHHGDGGRAR